jgi:hypothetical protein
MELGINTTFTFYVMQDEEASGALQVDQLKPIRDEFLSDVKDHLESELQYDHEVEVRIETTSVSMEGLAEDEPHFEIRTIIRFRSEELDTPGALDYLKEKLKHWTRVIGGRLYQSETDSGHYVSGVAIAFPQNGGKRKSKKRSRRRRFTR